jgi:hypothetical protein
MSFSSKLFCLSFGVPPDQISPLVCLKIPGRNQNDVSFTYPDSSLHLAAYSAQSLVTVLTLHKYSIVSKQFDCYPQDIVLRRKHQPVQLAFRQNLLLTQQSTSNTLPYKKYDFFLLKVCSTWRSVISSLSARVELLLCLARLPDEQSPSLSPF